MPVPAFLAEVQFRLVAHKELVTAILETDARGVELVTIAQTDAMKIATNQYGHRIGGTACHTAIEHFLLVLVLQASRHIYPVGRSVSTCQQRRVY